MVCSTALNEGGYLNSTYIYVYIYIYIRIYNVRVGKGVRVHLCIPFVKMDNRFAGGGALWTRRRDPHTLAASRDLSTSSFWNVSLEREGEW